MSTLTIVVPAGNISEYAIKHRDLVTLVSLDDKHKSKCGEPSYTICPSDCKYHK